MIINEFECPADMDALNTELEVRKIDPEHLAAVMFIRESGGGGMGEIVTKYRVLYWDSTVNNA